MNAAAPEPDFTERVDILHVFTDPLPPGPPVGTPAERDDPLDDAERSTVPFLTDRVDVLHVFSDPAPSPLNGHAGKPEERHPSPG